MWIATKQHYRRRSVELRKETRGEEAFLWESLGNIEHRLHRLANTPNIEHREKEKMEAFSQGRGELILTNAGLGL